VKPNGGRLWHLKYRIDGREKVLSLGVYPDLSLAKARERRDEARGLLTQPACPRTAGLSVVSPCPGAHWAIATAKSFEQARIEIGGVPGRLGSETETRMAFVLLCAVGAPDSRSSAERAQSLLSQRVPPGHMA
jgi:hypothetical protein